MKVFSPIFLIPIKVEMTGYYKFQFEVAEQKKDQLLAFLSLMDFESFEEEAYALNAYLPENDNSDAFDTQLKNLIQPLRVDFEKSYIPPTNWNAVWESNFSPIKIDDFCYIRAAFHEDIKDVKHVIHLNPKMAFGTGHHATTYMMIQFMSKIDFKGKQVFDFGCGTGILAILAAKMGAKTVYAIDIESWSAENTVEHIELNDVSNIVVEQATITEDPAAQYDIILANINRNVILESLPILKKQLNPNGAIFFSGILKEDEELVFTSLKKAGFVIRQSASREQWLALHCNHK